MNSTTRSVSGAVLMLAIIPVIVGLLACLPVPVGDPERSRIDPELSGVWAMTEDATDSGMYIFRPYDRRTWLVIGIEKDKPGSATVYKAWLTKLGGEKFMTWEMAGGFKKDGGFLPEYWLVFRVEKEDANRVKLHMLNYEYDGFKVFPDPDEYDGDYGKDMRRQFERVIKKNVDDDDMYGEALVLRRLADDELADASDRFQEIISFD